MNWKSTLALLLLTAAAGAWLWKGDTWAPRLGLHTSAPAPAESPSVAALAGHITRDRITRIEIPAESGPAFVLEKAPTEAGWKLPGNWPLRKPEVDELVGLLANLRTRFQPFAIAADTDLSPYGLAAGQKPFTVKVAVDGSEYTLTFGEAKSSPDEPPFTRPAYVRVNDFPEVLRLGPDVMPVLRRSPDTYRKRQLFPDAERIKVFAASAPSPFGPPPGGQGVSTVTLLGDKVTEIDVRGPGRTIHLFGGSISQPAAVTLKRVGPFPQPVAAEKGGEPAVRPDALADAWEITAPARDRIDPEKLQKVLTAIPDLWVEEFVTDAAKAGLDKPDRSLTVVRTDGTKVTLQIGAVARTATREETVPGPPPMPGFPPLPMTRTVTDEYRYAKLADNPQVFVVRADHFADLFVNADELRDPKLARFSPDEVQFVTVEVPGRPAVKLLRKQDGKWVIDRGDGDVAAESALVSDLIRQLSDLHTTSGEAAGGPTDGPTVTLTTRKNRPDDQPAAPARTYTLHLGKARPGAWPVIASATSALVAVAAGANLPPEPVPVRVDGRTRGGTADAAVLKAVTPEGGFRDRSLAGFTGADKITVERDGKALTFTKTGGVWKQTAPKEADAESTELDDLALSLGRLRAERFVAENPTPAELKQYGLDKPQERLTVFAGGNVELDLRIGTKDSEGRVYATAAGDAVAVLPANVSKQLLADFRRKKVWELDEARVDAIEVDRGGKKFKLVRKDAGWEDPAAPKDVIDVKAASELLTTLGGLRAEKWVGDRPEDVKRAGLEKPAGTIALTLRGAPNRVLYLGGPADGTSGKQVYARVGDPPGEVFLLSAADTAKLTRGRAEYLEKK
jgi:hypothetical protein